MNLDLVPLGWNAFRPSVVALVLGLVMLLGPKGEGPAAQTRFPGEPWARSSSETSAGLKAVRRFK
jgi:hypothetical protein